MTKISKTEWKYKGYVLYVRDCDWYVRASIKSCDCLHCDWSKAACVRWVDQQIEQANTEAQATA